MSGSAGVNQRSIGVLFSEGIGSGLTDAELLMRFRSASRDSAESAFETLMMRHGSMVLAVCTKILRDRHDAEDAFQATFLILATRARAIRSEQSVASWLHGVAIRVATRLRDKTRRRRSGERRLDEVPDQRMHVGGLCPENDGVDHEALHQEVQRLPRKYRDAIVLCYLEGMTHEAAGSHLRCASSTVGVRLMRARRKLKARLSRGGISEETGAVIMVPDLACNLPVIPDSLAASTIRLVTGAGGALSHGASQVLSEILRHLVLMKAARIAAIFVASIIAVTSLSAALLRSGAGAGFTLWGQRNLRLPVFRIKQQVVMKYPMPIRDGDRIVDEGNQFRVYTVAKVENDRIRVSFEGISGWVRLDDLVPLDQAIEFYTSEVTNKGDRIQVYLYRGLVWEYLNEMDKAIADFSVATRLWPNEYAPFVCRGNAYSRQRDVERALADYNESIRLEPEYAWQYLSRAEIHFAMSDYDKAIADCDEVIRRDPERNGPGVRGEGLRRDALQEMAKREEQLAKLRERIRQDPRDLNAYLWRAWYRWTMKDYHSALADYNQATQIEPANAAAWVYLAGFLAACPDVNFRNFEKARESAIKACDLTGWKNPEEILTLAEVCSKAGDAGSAKRWKTKARELATEACESVAWKDPELVEWLADVCYQTGDFKSAERWQKKAAQLLEEASHRDPMPSPKLPLPESASPFEVMGRD